jgi:hypothetical protein
MAEAPPSSEGKRLTPSQLHHHETRFLKALELVLQSGKVRTIEDLIRYAEQDNQREAASYLRGLVAEAVPVDLAFDALRVHIRMVAHKRNSTLLAACDGKNVGLVLPLPPHVIDAFTSMTGTTLLIPDGHHLPPHLRTGGGNLRQGSRAAREAVSGLDVIVFEAFRSGSDFYVDVGTADVVDLRIVPAAAQLIVHVRPHRNPNDVLFAAPSRTLQVL